MSQTIVKVNQLKLISILVFDECKILESKSENDRQLLLKEFNLTDDYQFNKHHKKYEQRQKLQHPNILNIINYFFMFEQQLCGQFYKIYILLECPQKTLYQIYSDRAQFTEPEMWTLLFSIVKGLQYLQTKQISHNSISLDHIYFLDQQPKIADPSYFNQTSLFASILQDPQQSDGYYLSPQLMYAIQQNNWQPKHNQYKSDVFSLGMCFLQLALLEPSDDCYQYFNGRFNEDSLVQKINQLQYSPQLNSLIQKMLTIDEDTRPDFIQLNLLIESSYQQFIQDSKSLNQHQTNVQFEQQQQPNLQQSQYPQQTTVAKSNIQQTTQISLNTQTLQSPIQKLQAQRIPTQQSQQSQRAQQSQYQQHSIHPPNIHSTLQVLTPQQQQFKQLSQQEQHSNYSQFNFQQNYQLHNQTAPIDLFSDISQSKNQDLPFQQKSQFVTLNQQIPQFDQFQLGQKNSQPQNPSQPMNQDKADSFTQFVQMPYAPKNEIDENIDPKEEIDLLQTKKEEKLPLSDYTNQYTNTKIEKFQEPKKYSEVEYSHYYSNKRENNKEAFSLPYDLPNDKSFKQPEPLIYHHESQQNSSIFSNMAIENVIEQYTNGSRYEGEKLNGMRHGRGKFFYQDGGLYDGEWKENKMHGKGTLYYATGKPAYEGDWNEDRFHGFGTLFNEIPILLQDKFDHTDFDTVEDYWVKYEGQFNDDNKEGKGALYLSNGEKFVGQFQKDFINGNGLFYCRNGRVIDGRWNNNKFIS